MKYEKNVNMCAILYNASEKFARIAKFLKSLLHICSVSPTTSSSNMIFHGSKNYLQYFKTWQDWLFGFLFEDLQGTSETH